MAFRTIYAKWKPPLKRNAPGHCSSPPSKKRREVHGEAEIHDAPPEDPETLKLKDILIRLNYDVDIRFHSTEQGTSECGYRAMLVSYLLAATERFDIPPDKITQEFFKTKEIVEFCNCILGLTPEEVPVPLSDNSLTKVSKRIEFLHQKFHLDPWKFKKATDASRMLSNLKCSLQKREVSGTNKLLHKIQWIIKDPDLKSKLEKWEYETENQTIDFDKAARSFENSFFPNRSEIPRWFSGVYSFSEFVKHMENLPREIQSDRSSQSKRCAIVNSIDRNTRKDGLDGHWFVVMYENYEMTERMKKIQGRTF